MYFTIKQNKTGLKQDNTGLLLFSFVTDSSLLKLILNYIFVEFNKNSYVKFRAHDMYRIFKTNFVEEHNNNIFYGSLYLKLNGTGILIQL